MAEPPTMMFNFKAEQSLFEARTDEAGIRVHSVVQAALSGPSFAKNL
eukprot:CAMPEP_0175878136 /NCGR_PEP_ID=MMETSP0107_2-20121207/41001_1 /TAXON_ID=195067 ORGANISM="Goniomonas pacifica, Strain CCMP1869" /NCGR_SAMPLE_ID=MMETSP0107_2 /ASSEMBLY_ACC=CAM_ASM_000203 /LENGTH=46 /DNA_ID= /DNA_START= /DNA_END= /DNA_ORIENTATION=